jgi:hypothetical protein
MWEPQPLTTLWAFTACYRDNFIFTFYILHFRKIATFSYRLCLEQKQTAVSGTVLVLHAGRQTHDYKKRCKQHSAGAKILHIVSQMSVRAAPLLYWTYHPCRFIQETVSINYWHLVKSVQAVFKKIADLCSGGGLWVAIPPPLLTRLFIFTGHRHNTNKIRPTVEAIFE